MEDDPIREFLVEGSEHLDELDRSFVALEQNPTDKVLLGAIFRSVHTVKGTAGFLGFAKLEALTHAGETLLVKVRAGELELDVEMASLLLRMLDAVRAMFAQVEATGTDGDDDHIELAAALLAVAHPDAPARTSIFAAARASIAAAARISIAAGARVSMPAAARVPFQVVAPPPPAPAPPPTVEPSQPLADDVGGAKASALADSTIRVDVALLDRVMNLVGELVLARNRILQFGTRVNDAGFANASQRLNLLTTELQEGVMKTRMQPIGSVWSRFPRVVRDLAHTCGKKIELDLDGADTELDRTIIDAIKDPLTHAVRNAVDHGIETPERRRAAGKPEVGRLLLRAFHEGGQVNIEVSDDGGGLDLGRIRARALERGLVTSERAARMSDREVSHLIFEPGFSTAEKVTNVSGRGVGMDVVKTNIEKIGGTVDLSSELGRGTTLKVKIPLTLAIIPALIVTAATERFAIPQVSLLELVRLEGEQAQRGIERVHGTTVYRLRGNLLPIVFLDRELELVKEPRAHDVVNIVVLQAEDRQFGLVVDGINDTEEIVVKPLGKELKGMTTFAGATIMGDGRVALILDVLGIAHRSKVVVPGRERTAADGAAATRAAAEPKEALLVLEVGASTRMAIPLAMVARLEEIALADVEQSGGRQVVQYRGAILPLVALDRAVGAEPALPSEGPLQVVVYSEQGRSVGFIVSRILDVVEDVVKICVGTEREGVLGMAVVQGKVTELLDVQGVLMRDEPGFFRRAA